ncbi:MAG: hypothetical protein GAK28_02437 [Luteibacter sp.]|uniref:hypothetical protein n=1 Tax=Luteibacter sp. TaxID=1886636 RepID=UPI00137EF518|nr:hypothetical protein [Luteibacter sp.]KAF1006761.1 MAG: hypothetical protein GAK28_02437 [Luteibacter sp.]
MNSKVKVTVRGTQFDTEVVGDPIGYFVVHRGVFDRKGKWVATHPATGCAAVTAPTREVAEWAARRLSDLGVDFDEIDTIEKSKALDPSVLNEIYLITGAARLGGMA